MLLPQLYYGSRLPLHHPINTFLLILHYLINYDIVNQAEGKMKWFTKKIDKVDGIEKVDRIKRSATHPGEGWFEAPDNKVHHGMPTSWLDKDNCVITEDKRIKLGIQKDHRGLYFDKETGKETRITKLDKEPSDNLTKEIPLENEPYQLFDKKKNKWIVDEKKKEIAEKEMQLGQLQADMDEADRKSIRSLRAYKEGRMTEKDKEEFNKLDTLIEKELRPKYNKIEDDLKKLKSA